MLLYDLEVGTKIYTKDEVYIIAEQDGMRTTCKTETKTVHLSATTPVESFGDGYKLFYFEEK